jgi:hypothetical protein
MNNKAKASKAAAGGAFALAAGLVGTTLLVGQLAAATPVPITADRQPAASASRYTGPTTPDAVDGWLRPWNEYTGPTTPDAAEHWIRYLRQHDRLVAQAAGRESSPHRRSP